MPDWHDVAAADQLTEDSPLGVAAGGQQIALFRLAGEVFALGDQCPHGYARFSEGYVEDGCVECPLHQGLVDIRTGVPRSPPIEDAVPTFPTRVVDGRVQVAV